MRLRIAKGRARVRKAGGEHEDALSKLHLQFSKDVASAIHSVKADHPAGNFWSSSAALNIGPLIGENRLALILESRGQYFPKGGYNFSVVVQPPLFSQEKEKWQPYFEAVAHKIPEAMKALSKYGKVKVLKPGGSGWPGIWVDIADDKIEEALSGIPKLARPLGSAIDQAIKSVKPKTP
jgi:hypothetical protein